MALHRQPAGGKGPITLVTLVPTCEPCELQPPSYLAPGLDYLLPTPALT